MIARLIDKAQSLVTGINLQMVAYVVGASFICFTLGYCQGKSNANAANAAKVELAAEKVKRAATQAELAATLADMTRQAKTKQEITELQEIVDEAQPGNDAGPAVAGVLDRLRRQRGLR
ncbi:hypothetical protein K7W03_14520 [Sphingobium sp. PNB]|uniref:hypothetical protein n=1 Tax=Sphingobium sp. PNB TaxID=863934 RepID=UPI001CA3ADC5|nr:hypothetical protein [Sphingobium sp. PNB]MCB4860806.1 hypothetical protein [Sphingobium sp. PNB]